MDANDNGTPERRTRVERGIYREPSGRYAVCFMLHCKPRFRTVDGDLQKARYERETLVAMGQAGALPASPRLRFATVAGWWLNRFEAKVAAGERRERTLEAHRYHLSRHLLPTLGGRLLRTIGVEDVAKLLTTRRANGCSGKTTAGALATLHSILRFALRNGWIVEDPVVKLETDERPHPLRRRQRVLGRGEIRRLLAACLPRYRPLIATGLYTGMRTSELLGLVWGRCRPPRRRDPHACSALARARRCTCAAGFAEDPLVGARDPARSPARLSAPGAPARLGIQRQ
jgi:hypothetical protein